MANVNLNFFVCLTALVGVVMGQSCPEKNGRFPISGQCDAYIECIDGVAKEELCPDGLFFNDKAGSGYACGYPIDVDCGPRTKTQSAQPTEECDHQFGYYAMGDSKNCGQFKNCASGRGFIFDCPDGLAWNAETYKCDWPDQVPSCDAEAFLGFKCPEIKKSNLLGEEEYRFYPSPASCQEYFVCIEGHPRKIGCGEGAAFNAEINACDDIENVKNCSGDVKKKGDAIKAGRQAAQAKPPPTVKKSQQNAFRGNQKNYGK